VGKASRQRRQKQEKERQRERAAAKAAGKARTAAADNARTSNGAGDARSAGGGESAGTASAGESRGVPSQRERAAALIGEAAQSVHSGHSGYDRCLAALADSQAPGWTEAVSRSLTESVRTAVSGAWRRGWQPAELARQISRELAGPHELMAGDLIADEMRGYPAAAVDPRWSAQVAALALTAPADGTSDLGERPWWGSDGDYLIAWQARAGDRTELGGLLGTVATAIGLLATLQRLPVLERLLPLPGTARPAQPARPAQEARVARPAPSTKASSGKADDRVLGRIRALLAKAESTGFAEEAEALSARAQELMAKYSIDHALLAARSAGGEMPSARRVPVDNPYQSAKVSLLHEVARANRCATVWLQEVGLVTVVGFDADLDVAEMLFTSLLVQANTAMLRADASQHARGRSRTREFRQSFLVSYAYRIGERLSEAAAHVVREAAGERDAQQEDQAGSAAGSQGTAGTALVPLLAARTEAVDEAVDEMFGDALTKSRGPRATDLDGWNSGRAAADTASLHGNAQVTE
jgi:hypothetical protein